jgi:hypothetical protein
MSQSPKQHEINHVLERPIEILTVSPKGLVIYANTVLHGLQ